MRSIWKEFLLHTGTECVATLRGNIVSGTGSAMFVCYLIDSELHSVDVLLCPPPPVQELERRCRRMVRTQSVPLEKYLVSAFPNDRKPCLFTPVWRLRLQAVRGRTAVKPIFVSHLWFQPNRAKYIANLLSILVLNFPTCVAYVTIILSLLTD
jgi:hypothetical protein